MTARTRLTLGLAALVVASGALPSAQQPAPRQEGDGFRFRTGVELINVAVSVSDLNGRYISGLRQDDFVLYEDGVEQQITHFSNERVPVSLGLVVDTSGSMAGEKWDHARSALDRFLLELLGEEDEVFLYQFSADPYLLEDWTTDRARLSRAMRRIVPRGGTAMYDTLAEAVPLADSGKNRKKAIVVISDGNDTNSSTSVPDLKRLIRETEVLVYAVGIDGEGECTVGGSVRTPAGAAALSIPDSRPATPLSGPAAVGRRRHARAARINKAIGSTRRRCASLPTTAAAAPRLSRRVATSIPPRQASPTS